jgi:hypothetical protein
VRNAMRYLMFLLLLVGMSFAAALDVYNLPLANPLLLPQSTVFDVLALNSIGGGTETKVGTVFMAPIVGTTSKITKAGFYISADTGDPSAITYRLSLQGVTAATGLPDGTIKHGATNNDVSVDFEMADNAIGFSGWKTLGDSGYSPTQGEALAVVLEPVDDPSSASITAAYGYVSQAQAQLSSFGVVMASGTWAIGTKRPTVCVQYADNSIPRSMTAISGITAAAWGSDDNPLYCGTKWTPQYNCRLVGAYFALRGAAGSDFAIELFTNKTETLTQSIDISQVISTVNGVLVGYVPFAPTNLTAGTVYRIMVEPTTTTHFISFLYASFPDVYSQQSFVGELKGTTLTADKATAVDYDNVSDGYRFYPVIPVIDQITVGGSVSPGFNGGFDQ